MTKLHDDTRELLPQGNGPSQTPLIRRQGFWAAVVVVMGCMVFAGWFRFKPPNNGRIKARPVNDPVQRPKASFRPPHKVRVVARPVNDHVQRSPNQITKPVEAECTGEHQDPDVTGKHEACCHGLTKQRGKWDGSGRQHYLCIDASKGGPTCEAQLDNEACVDPRGNWQCFTCGERITWLQENRGLERKEAQHRVANEFFGECGACAEDRGGFVIEKKGYRLVWADEFNASGPVDINYWKSVHSHGDGFGSHQLQYYTDRQKNAWVSDGTLKIRAMREDFGGKNYTSAQLETHEAWKYGKFSVRARLLGTARGTWPANWLFPVENKYGDWPNSGQIDIMVHAGYEPGRIHGTVHTGAYHRSIGTQKGGSMHVDVEQWRTYTVEWRPEVILFACDDVVYQVFQKESDSSTVWPFNQRFFLILNMAVGGELGGVKGVDEAAFSGMGQIMEIDWVRIEQRDLAWARR